MKNLGYAAGIIIGLFIVVDIVLLLCAVTKFLLDYLS